MLFDTSAAHRRPQQLAFYRVDDRGAARRVGRADGLTDRHVSVGQRRGESTTTTPRITVVRFAAVDRRASSVSRQLFQMAAAAAAAAAADDCQDDFSVTESSVDAAPRPR